MSKIVKKEDPKKHQFQLLQEKNTSQFAKTHLNIIHHALKTQHTSDHKNSQFFSQMFEQFDHNFVVKYRHLPQKNYQFSFRRCLYSQLLELRGDKEAKMGVKKKRKINTQGYETNGEKSKKSSKVSRENTCKKILFTKCRKENSCQNGKSLKTLKKSQSMNAIFVGSKFNREYAKKRQRKYKKLSQNLVKLENAKFHHFH